MAHNTHFLTTLSFRLRRGFAIGLVAVTAALYSQAPAPAEATPKKAIDRPPVVVRPPVATPPRTGIDGARGYRAPLAEERDRWKKFHDELTENPPVRNKKTGKWGVKGTNETFDTAFAAHVMWQAMLDVFEPLTDGDLKGVQAAWKIHYKNFRKTGHLLTHADQMAQSKVFNIMEKVMRDEEYRRSNPPKTGSPVTN